MGLTVVAGLALMSAPAVWAGELASYNFSAGPAGVGADNVTAGRMQTDNEVWQFFIVYYNLIMV